MKWINKIAVINSRLLSKETQIDGRLLVLLALAIYFISIFASSFFTRYDVFWNMLGVPAVPPPFWDLRVITSGFECHRLGYDVIVSNPCNPGVSFREVNYPRVWMSLASLGLGQNQNFQIGILIILLFYYSIFLVIPHINYIEALVYSLILCSPSIMLGVERANNDLIIFGILSASTLLLSKHRQVWRFLAYFTILFAAILKLYPIFSLTVIVKERRRSAYIIGAFLGVIFVVYIFATFHDLQLISSATPRVDHWSYGYKIFFDLLHNDLKKIGKFLGISKGSVYTIFPDLSITVTVLLKAVLGGFAFILTLISIIAIFIVFEKTKGLDISLNKHFSCQSTYIDIFRLRASIYIGTFLLGNNWCYRLVFLVFAIPQILTWIKSYCPLSVFSNFALAGIILTLWMKTTIDHGPGMFLHQLIDWFLFFYFIYTLLFTLPDWLKLLIWKRNRFM